jgi:hypothetical protein
VLPQSLHGLLCSPDRPVIELIPVRILRLYYPKKNCNLNEIGDEYHFFLKCTANHSLRNNLFNKIILNKPDFIEEIPLNKIKNLLDANSELLAEVGDFIKQSTELQK